MSTRSIVVENLGKQYRIGEKNPYKYISANPTEASRVPEVGLKRLLGHLDKKEILWALRDVSFEVKRNEVIGIVGRNGSGKSTLLKILSRVTAPTEGRVELWGNSASLLEVGTGFHPDLTGRENVYLNGSILGMKRRDIDAKFQTILDFSELHRFIDTPVKRYSSGMAVRLAFAVAAHLEPEIMMVDEVLAVGDLQFQRKCLSKMKDVVTQGKTVLFVSHQMGTVRRLCTSCLWLEGGRVKMLGPTTKVVTAYESASMTPDPIGDGQSGPTQFLRWEIEKKYGGEPHWFEKPGPVVIKFTVRVDKQLRNGQHGVALWSGSDDLMWGTALQNIDLEPGIHEFVHALPDLPLKPGIYRWHVSLWDGSEALDEWYAVPELIIATPPVAHHSDQWAGFLNIASEIKINRVR